MEKFHAWLIISILLAIKADLAGSELPVIVFYGLSGVAFMIGFISKMGRP